MYVMINVRAASGPSKTMGKNFNIAICINTINMINVKLGMVVVLIELYPFMPFSVTLIVCQGHSGLNSLAENCMFLFD